ncbi:MAG: rod-binding protein [Nitrospirae bacterium]|nr:rod-binding protein [Nitrospirota bacterium]
MISVQNTGPGAQTSDKSEIRKAAKEMEAFFIYELVKVMRKTSESISPEEKGLGNDSYMSLFDMEVSKVMAERGFGLQDAIVDWLERSPNIVDNVVDSGHEE